MSDTPTDTNQEEIEAVAIALARLEADQMGTRNYEPSSFNRRDAQAAITALDNYRAKHLVIPKFMEQVYVFPEDDNGNSHGHIGIYNADATVKLDEVEGWHLFRFKDKDPTNE